MHRCPNFRIKTNSIAERSGNILKLFHNIKRESEVYILIAICPAEKNASFAASVKCLFGHKKRHRPRRCLLSSIDYAFRAALIIADILGVVPYIRTPTRYIFAESTPTPTVETTK